MCDFLADAGYLVIMPDFYRGDMCEPTEARIGTFIKGQLISEEFLSSSNTLKTNELIYKIPLPVKEVESKKIININ